MRLAAWNAQTLLDRGDRHERRTAIIARELARYSIYQRYRQTDGQMTYDSNTALMALCTCVRHAVIKCLK